MTKNLGFGRMPLPAEQRSKRSKQASSTVHVSFLLSLSPQSNSSVHQSINLNDFALTKSLPSIIHNREKFLAIPPEETPPLHLMNHPDSTDNSICHFWRRSFLHQVLYKSSDRGPNAPIVGKREKHQRPYKNK